MTVSGELNLSRDDDLFEELVSGSIFAGYRVLGLLGRGGRGAVYLAESSTLGEKVAIKILHSGADTRVIELFQKEARICSRLSDEFIVRFKSYGIESNCSYLVMEYIAGEPLDKFIEKWGVPEPSVFLSIFRDVVAGLSYAHSMHILHRDIKPANILILRAEASGAQTSSRHLSFAEQSGSVGGGGFDVSVKLVDFGLAKDLSVGTVEQSTTSGVLRGSPAYMSPEQCRGEKLDVRSDIYSLGCTMYQSLIGKPPFEAETAFAVMGKHLNDAPIFPENAAVSDELKELVIRCLEKEPDKRFQSMSEISTILMGWDTAKLSVPLVKRGTRQNLLHYVLAVILVALAGVSLAIKSHRSGSVSTAFISKAAKPSAREPISLLTSTPQQLVEMYRLHYEDRISEEPLRYITAACQKADAGNDVAMQVLCHTELLALVRRRFDRAGQDRETEVLQALVIASGDRLPDLIGYRARRELANSLLYSHRYADAMKWYRISLQKMGNANNAESLNRKHETFESLGTCSAELGNYDAAIEYAHQAMEYGDDEQRSCRKIQAVRYALLSGSQRKFENAFAKLDLNDKQLVNERAGVELGRLGRGLLDCNRPVESKRCLNRAVEILSGGKVKWHVDSTACLISLATIAQMEGKRKEALRLNDLAAAEIRKQYSILRTASEIQRDDNIRKEVEDQRKKLEAS